MGVKEAWSALWGSQQVVRRKEGPVIAYSNIGTQASPKDKYYDLAKDGYQDNAVVYRCINEIALGAASVNFKIMRGDQPIEDHPVLDLLHRPNPMNSGTEFFQKVYSYLLLSGNSFVLKTGPDNQPPNELYCLRPDRVRIVPSSRDIPKRYQ